MEVPRFHSRFATWGLLGSALLGGLACASVSPAVVITPERAVTVEKLPPTPGVVHIVAAGQTLYSIARTYGVTVRELTIVNDLSDPDLLHVGQRIVVPGAEHALPVPLPAVADADGRNLLWPVAGGSVLSYFGAPRGNRLHAGVDIRGHQDQPVVAVEAGRVAYSGDGMRGYGKTVVIDHGNGLQSLYAHNSKLLVQPGEHVLRGQAVARIGRSGNASTFHCHLEIRQDKVPRDPLLFMAQHAGRR